MPRRGEVPPKSDKKIGTTDGHIWTRMNRKMSDTVRAQSTNCSNIFGISGVGSRFLPTTTISIFFRRGPWWNDSSLSLIYASG